MAKVAVVIPAAGAGERFGGNVKKPFAQIDTRPIFIRSIELFVNRSDVVQIVLTVAPEDYEVVKEKYAANLMFMGIKLVKGGAERFDSVRLALEHIDAAAELVCVHDAVRPCVLESWIDQVFKQAAETGAAILAAPLTGTIKHAKDKLVEKTVPRKGLYEAQTPQVFRKELLLKAYAEVPDDFQPTDDAQVIERAGHPVAIVASDHRNIKITTAGDMSLAAAILKDIARKAKAGGPRRPFEEAQW
jgi:2-C-methyl-D-erythritol 4-phosphate cytidylyltransferase